LFKVTSINNQEKKMKLEEIKEIAKQHDIKIGKMKKAELVRAIQSVEGNNICFETGQALDCGQTECLWRVDCN
jgi:hypothetical protein